MNKTSTDKIRSATQFLVWFRRYLPDNLQAKVRPYLDEPYQLALKVLDVCHSGQRLRVEDIAQRAEVKRETARQVLRALKEGGMPLAVTPVQGWQLLEAELSPSTIETANSIGCGTVQKVLLPSSNL
ncbi:hypothetical protein ACQ4M3_30800 [Leptolyngbya sp. AN03gr2]|uniref:hypothetical protein n=1 Tax=unclassified Leptolyngbya TaxID=2650499 RepID=UPI003D31C2FB